MPLPLPFAPSPSGLAKADRSTQMDLANSHRWTWTLIWTQQWWVLTPQPWSHDRLKTAVCGLRVGTECPDLGPEPSGLNSRTVVSLVFTFKIISLFPLVQPGHLYLLADASKFMPTSSRIRGRWLLGLTVHFLDFLVLSLVLSLSLSSQQILYAKYQLAVGPLPLR